MCGIVGFNWEDEALIKRMTDLIEHRGPDDEGFFVNEGVSLGSRRLSILDLKTAISKRDNPITVLDSPQNNSAVFVQHNIVQDRKDVCCDKGQQVYQSWHLVFRL